jgi:hypothetical protein
VLTAENDEVLEALENKLALRSILTVVVSSVSVTDTPSLSGDDAEHSAFRFEGIRRCASAADVFARLKSRLELPPRRVPMRQLSAAEPSPSYSR